MKKDFKTTSKLHQSDWTCTDAVMKHTRGRGKKAVVFFPKTSYKLGTDEKRGEQEGFYTLTLFHHNPSVGQIQIAVFCFV